MNTLTDTEKRAVAFTIQLGLELAHTSEIDLQGMTLGIDPTDEQQARAKCLELVERMPEDMARRYLDGLIALGGPRLVDAWGHPR